MTAEDTELIDISPLISEDLAVFPGDKSFEREALLSFEKGNHLRLSKIHSTLHLGAHADAPCHYDRDGQSIDELSLEIFVGPCTLVDASAFASPLLPEIIAAKKLQKRVLIKTNSFDPNTWSENYSALSPELVDELARKGVELVGVDTPSVDQADSKELPIHAAFARTKMLIIEGLVLSSVPEADYELIALPLKIKGADASPVKAVLRTLS